MDPVKDSIASLMVGTPSEGAPPLQLRLRCLLRKWKLPLPLDKRGTPRWSNAKYLYNKLSEGAWCVRSLQRIYEHPDTKASHRDLIRLFVSKAHDIPECAEIQNAINDIRYNPFVNETSNIKDVNQADIKEALAFGYLGARFCPIEFLEELHSVERVDDASRSSITTVLLCVFLHYFPLRGSTVAGLKIKDLDSIIAREAEGIILISFVNQKTSKHMMRAFPSWVGELLHLYVSKFRPHTGNCQGRLFVHPTKCTPFDSHNNCVGKFLERMYKRFRGHSGISYVRGNIKRKVLEISLSVNAYAITAISGAVEHGSSAGNRHYQLDTVASATAALRYYILGYRVQCKEVSIRPPVEFERMVMNVLINPST